MCERCCLEGRSHLDLLAGLTGPPARSPEGWGGREGGEGEVRVPVLIGFATKVLP